MAAAKDENISDVEDEDDENEGLDPRVQEELECLNTASVEINKLESELEHARTKYRTFLAESTKEVDLLYKKLGKCILKVRPYFDMLKDLQKAQAEAQRAVVKYQRANSIYKAAREMVALAEERVTDPDGNKRGFDSAWQEMLNHATTKFMESEVEKARSEEEHMKRASECAEISKKLQEMEKEWHRSIPKSRPYYEVRERTLYMLAQEKQNVEDIQLALHLAKQNYREALGKLEEISEEVHQRRRFKKHLPPRTPGVGAENDDISVSSDLPSITFDSHLERQDSFSDIRESDLVSEDSWKMCGEDSEQTVQSEGDIGQNSGNGQPSNIEGASDLPKNLASGVSALPVNENCAQKTESAPAALRTSTAQIKLAPTAKTSLPVLPASSKSSLFSVLSVHDLLAGERCDRVTRQIESFKLHNQATDPMQFLNVSKNDTSHSLAVNMSMIAAKTMPKDSNHPTPSTTSRESRSAERPISERESSMADGRELNENEMEASRQSPKDDLPVSDCEKPSESVNNNNLQTKDSSSLENREIFV